MNHSDILIEWPNGICSKAKPGAEWLELAKAVGMSIPTGCLSGSCGACEIEVNGKVIRACISNLPNDLGIKYKVDFSYDPYW